MTNEQAFTMLEHAVEYIKNEYPWTNERGQYLVFNQTVNTLVEAHKAIGPLGQIPSWELCGRSPMSAQSNINDPSSKHFGRIL